MLRTVSSSRATTTTTTAAVGFLSQTLIPIFRHFSSTSHRKRSGESSDEASEDDLGAFVVDRDRNGPPKLFVVQPRLRPEPLLQAKLSEALNLAESLADRRDGDGGCGGEEVGEWTLPPHLVVQNPLARSRGSADKFFGPGTVETVKCHLQAIDSEDGPDGIFVNAILSGVQQRNLENAWGKPVLDRIGLIIEIFNAHAQTKEAKLQSELAALMYKSTRLVRVRGPSGRLAFGTSGEAEVVSAKGKGSGGRGFLSGAGESEIQLQRRRIQERREKLLCEIEEVRRTRALQRYARKRRGGTLGQGLPTIAVVGYTNAGKSTLVGALSRSDLYRDNRLFATVDPRLRNVILPSGRKALLSDTVGFISDLPLQLVEAFHATLEEVVDADLLVHVLDSSAKDLDDQRSTVLEVLKQIGVSDEKIQNMIEVWNKIDLLDRESGDFGTQGEGSNDGTVGGGFTNTDDNLLQQSPRMHGAEDGFINEITSDDDFSDSGFPDGDKKKKVVSHCGHKKEEDVDIHAKLMVGAGFRSFPRAPTRDLDAEDYEEVVNYQEHDDDMESQLSENSTDDNDPSLPLPSERPPVSPFKTCKPKDVQCVKTSAVKGVGLQELLHLIDLKLSNGKSLEKENTTEIFDRKWRPSHGNVGKVAAVR